MLLMVLLMRRAIVHIIVTTRRMMRSTVQTRVAVGVRNMRRTGLVHTLARTTSWRSRSWTGRINGRILDIHEGLAHPNSVAGVGSTIIRVRLTVVRAGVIVWERRRISLLSTLAWTTTSRLALRGTACASLTTSRSQRVGLLLRGLLRLMGGGRFAMIVRP
jgi:hypothetical protein